MMNKYDFNKGFPAVAIAPRASIIATVYTVLPALVVAIRGCFYLSIRQYE